MVWSDLSPVRNGRCRSSDRLQPLWRRARARPVDRGAAGPARAPGADPSRRAGPAGRRHCSADPGPTEAGARPGGRARRPRPPPPAPAAPVRHPLPVTGTDPGVELWPPPPAHWAPAPPAGSQAPGPGPGTGPASPPSPRPATDTPAAGAPAGRHHTRPGSAAVFFIAAVSARRQPARATYRLRAGVGRPGTGLASGERIHRRLGPGGRRPPAARERRPRRRARRPITSGNRWCACSCFCPRPWSPWSTPPRSIDGSMLVTWPVRCEPAGWRAPGASSRWSSSVRSSYGRWRGAAFPDRSPAVPELKGGGH